MGRHELVAAIEKHGGYVTPGMVAHHMGYCAAGTAEFMAGEGFDGRIYRYDEVRWQLNSQGSRDGSGRELMRLLRDVDLAVSARPKGFSSTYRSWKDIVGRDTLSNSEVTYLGHRLGEVLGGNRSRSKLSEDEATDLVIHVMWHVRKHGGYKLTYEQVEKGKAWLGRRDVVKELSGYFANPTTKQSRLVEIATTVHDFRFVGFAKVENGSAYFPRTAYKPMYEAISEHGSFIYRASPWVDGSGRRLEIF